MYIDVNTYVQPLSPLLIDTEIPAIEPEYSYLPVAVPSIGNECDREKCQKAEKYLLQLIIQVPEVLTMTDSQGWTLLHYLARNQCIRLDKIDY